MQGEADKLTVFLTEDDRVGHEAAWEVLLRRARDDGMAGATAWRGIEGVGRRGYVRSSRSIDAGQGPPVTVEVIDRADRIDAFLPVVSRFAAGALVVRERVRVSPRRPAGLRDTRPPSPAGSA